MATWNLILFVMLSNCLKNSDDYAHTQDVTAVQWRFAVGCYLRYMVVMYDGHRLLLVHAERLKITDELPVNQVSIQSLKAVHYTNISLFGI